MTHRRRKPTQKDTIKYLIGPTKCFSQQEMKIYSLASLCKVSEVDREIKLEEDNASSDEKEALLFKPWTSFPKLLFRQTYKQWKASMDLSWRLGQIRKRKVIYIQPLDTFPDFIENFMFANISGFFEFLRSFCEIYFLGFQVRLLPALNMEDSGWNISSRIHKKTQQKQYLVKDIQKCLQKHVPKDGYCVVGISWTDLYPSENLNFVLGEASAGFYSGVICFGRFEPKKYQDGQPPPPVINQIDDNLVWRMIKVITHETCHILGIAHCNFFDCSMNESTSMDQAMLQPLFLCLVCLRKLQKSAKFNIEDRYTKLLEFLQAVEQCYENVRITNSILWLKQVLALLKSDGPEIKCL